MSDAFRSVLVATMSPSLSGADSGAARTDFADVIVKSAPEVAVHRAASVAEAMRLLRVHRVNCVLIDEWLEDGCALDFLRQMATGGAAAAVVVVSHQHGDDEGVQTLLERGAQEVVPPNLGCAELLHVLRRGAHRQRAQADLRRQNRELQLANAELVAIAQHDPMTGLLNRRGLAEALAREAERARRTTTRLAVVLADCDDFKSINDDYGYEAGDRVLTEVARALAEVVRPTDYVVRLGGDEFLILLTEVRAEECRNIAERVRSAVAGIELESAVRPMPVTCSVGWAWLKDDQLEVDTIVQFAEGALKRSKAVGKDTVSGCAPSLPAPSQSHRYHRMTASSCARSCRPSARATACRSLGSQSYVCRAQSWWPTSCARGDLPAASRCPRSSSSCRWKTTAAPGSTSVA